MYPPIDGGLNKYECERARHFSAPALINPSLCHIVSPSDMGCLSEYSLEQALISFYLGVSYLKSCLGLDYT